MKKGLLLLTIMTMMVTASFSAIKVAPWDIPLQKQAPKSPNCWCITSTYVGSVCCVYPDPNARQGQVSLHLAESRPWAGYAHFLVRTWERRFLWPQRKVEWCWGWVNVNIEIPAGQVYAWAEVYLEEGELIDEVNYTYDGPYQR